MLSSQAGRHGRITSARAGMSAPRIWRSSGRGCTVRPSAPASCASRAKSRMSGTPVRRELRSSAILLRFTESRAMTHYNTGSKGRRFPFQFEGAHSKARQVMDQRVVETPERARSARKYGVLRYILGISLVLVVIAFAVAYVTSV